MKKFMIIIVLALLLTACQPGQVFGPSLTPTFTVTLTPTSTTTLTSTPTHTSTYTPTITSTPTITLTPTITPTLTPTLVSGSKLHCTCDSSKGIDVSFKAEYDIGTGVCSQLPTDNSIYINQPYNNKDMKSIYKHYWQENLVWLGFSDDQITKFLSFIPDSFYELHADFYAATKDHTKLIVNLVPGYQPNPSEIKGDLYLIDINGTIKNYEINLNGWGRQETQISRNKELMGIRLPLIGDRESLFVFSLIDGAMANITPNINKAYGIRFSPDSRQVAYYSDQGIWISSVDGKDQKLVIKNPELSLWTPDGKGAKNVDWSPDGKELVFLMDDSLHISTVDGTNITELLDQNGRNFTDANYPEWVQANGKRQIIYQTLENEWGLIDLETGKNRMFGNWKGRSLYRFPSRWLDWSPDGKWFRGSYDDDKNNIYKDYLCSIESVTCKSIYSLDCNGSEREGGNCYCLWR